MTSISAANNTSVMTIAGTYYFPNSSKSQPLHLAFDEQGTLSLPAFENEVESMKKYSFDQCKVSEPLGSAPRFIDFPDGGRFESSDHGGFALLSKTIKASSQTRSKKSIESWVDALERRWSMVAASVVALVLFSFLFLNYGVPPLADAAAKISPKSWQVELAEQSMAELDKSFFEPTKIDAETQQRLQIKFEQLNPDGEYQLYFRSSWIGANALAIPGGAIVITDGLIELAENDEQILSVLAHEVGHQALLHGLRRIYRSIGISALFVVFTGDLNSVTQVVLAAPVILMEMSYSREFEIEADIYALEQMAKLNIAPQRFAEILTLLQASHEEPARTTEKSVTDNSAVENSNDSAEEENLAKKELGEDDSQKKLRGLAKYLSSHPATEERIERINAQ